MGSLTSGPKVQQQQPQVVYVSAPATSTSSSTASSGGTSGSSTSTSSASEDIGASASELRQQSLLGRERSRFGTIQTSFRGFLGLADQSVQPRKTLLGE